MKINNLGNNKIEVVNNSGSVVLFSYNTPVAAEVDYVLYCTDKFWSVTTSQHISKWLDGRNAENKPQEFFNNLAGEI